jgi:hypothetical protein
MSDQLLSNKRTGVERGALSNNSKAPKLVDEVVLRLNDICKTATLDFAMSVGRLIIETIYGGDLGRWRARGAKVASFRALANHPHLPMSAASLYRSVAIYELCERLGIKEWKHVSTSHLRLVLPLSLGEQGRLLKAAEEQRWPVRRLEEEIASIELEQVEARARRGGRPKRTRLKSTLRRLETCVDRSDKFSGTDELTAEPSPESALEIVRLMARLKHACTVLERSVSRLLPQGPDSSLRG